MLVPPRVCKREYGAVRGEQHMDPQPLLVANCFSPCNPVTTGWAAARSTHRPWHSLHGGTQCPAPQEAGNGIGHLP